jgi:enamine deaminase RidA (YjgF/YER057c/UK114 family)
MNEIFNAPELPAPRGFSHAVKAGDTVYLAGQIGDGATIAEQFGNAARNLRAALEAAGGRVTDIVSLQIFTTDVDLYKTYLQEVGEAYREHFGTHFPAMGLFGVTKLFEPSAMVELMGVAVLTR